MSDTIDRRLLLKELGYGSSKAQDIATEVLVAAGLTKAHKKNIALEKRERVREVLAQALIRLCPGCASLAEPGKRQVPCGHPSECEECGGAPNRLALTRAAQAFRQRGLRRLLVVGGAPSAHEVLRSEWPTDLALRIVDGEPSHSLTAATANLEWADVVVVWGATILPHCTSRHYTRHYRHSAKVIQLRRRGVESLAHRLIEHLK